MLFVGSFPQAFLFVGLPCCNGTDRGKGDEGRGGQKFAMLRQAVCQFGLACPFPKSLGSVHVVFLVLWSWNCSLL